MEMERYIFKIEERDREALLALATKRNSSGAQVLRALVSKLLAGEIEVTDEELEGARGWQSYSHQQ